MNLSILMACFRCSVVVAIEEAGRKESEENVENEFAVSSGKVQKKREV